MGWKALSTKHLREGKLRPCIWPWVLDAPMLKHWSYTVSLGPFVEPKKKKKTSLKKLPGGVLVEKS